MRQLGPDLIEDEGEELVCVTQSSCSGSGGDSDGGIGVGYGKVIGDEALEEASLEPLADAGTSPQKKKVVGWVGLRINTSACNGKNAKDLFAATAKHLGWREVEVDVARPTIAPVPGAPKRRPGGVPSVYCIMQGTELMNLLPLSHGCWATRYLGMPDLCDKGNLARMILLCQDVVDDGAFDFNPLTWLLPEQEAEMKEAMVDPKGKTKTVIVKPEDGSQGDGIFLCQNPRDFDIKMGCKSNKAAVAQKYLAKPLLIQGFKFDFRIYVALIGGGTGSPPRVFLCREGLARFCTEAYEVPAAKNLHKCLGHLTNYSLNKRSELFEHSGITMEEVFHIDSNSSKRPLTVALQQLVQEFPDFDPEEFYGLLIDLVRTTCALYAPALAHSGRDKHGTEDGSMRSCQVLGFDVMMDSKRKPWLLEVNNSPSMAIDECLALDPDEAAEYLQNLPKFRPTEKRGADQAAICRCMDMGQPHRHRTSTVDLAIKRCVFAGVFRLLHRLNKVGVDAEVEVPEDFMEVNVREDPVYDFLSRVEVIFNRGGGAGKAFSSSGLRRALGPLCGLGSLQKTDLDILAMKCRQTRFTSRDPAVKPDAMRLFDYVQVLRQVAEKSFPGESPQAGLQLALTALGA
mmetsp:Transcript_36268/g.117269  ORF Transcript_36268/g.117269 Transcript_36268/m.117269 type:complete len:627 (-) Transcript_36268:165-2045(-)